jgi:ribonucleotide monophosphatase NagD (HAD superfamily)
MECPSMFRDVQALMIDLDGVLDVGEHPIASAIEAVERLRRRGLRLRFVTNTTAHSRNRTLDKLARLGFSVADLSGPTGGDAAPEVSG